MALFIDAGSIRGTAARGCVVRVTIGPYRYYWLEGEILPGEEDRVFELIVVSKRGARRSFLQLGFAFRLILRDSSIQYGNDSLR